MGLCSDSTSYYRLFGPCLDFSLIPCEEKKTVSVLVEGTGFPPIRIEWDLPPAPFTTLEAVKGADRPFLMSINQVILIQVTDAKKRGFVIFFNKHFPLYFIFKSIFRGMSCGLPGQPL